MKQQQHDINFQEDSEKNPSPRWDNVYVTCVGPPPPPPPLILLLKYHLNHWYFPLVCTGGWPSVCATGCVGDTVRPSPCIQNDAKPKSKEIVKNTLYLA